jgi:hypothetical protein
MSEPSSSNYLWWLVGPAIEAHICQEEDFVPIDSYPDDLSPIDDEVGLLWGFRVVREARVL